MHTVEKCAEHICEKADEFNLTEGREYLSTTAAAIYMACQLKINTADHRTYEQIAEWTGVAEVTIKQTFRDLHAKRHQLVPEGFATKDQIDRLPEH